MAPSQAWPICDSDPTTTHSPGEPLTVIQNVRIWVIQSEWMDGWTDRWAAGCMVNDCWHRYVGVVRLRGTVSEVLRCSIFSVCLLNRIECVG